jgi:hypothetical protein
MSLSASVEVARNRPAKRRVLLFAVFLAALGLFGGLSSHPASAADVYWSTFSSWDPSTIDRASELGTVDPSFSLFPSGGATSKPTYPVVHGGYVYWANEADSKIGRAKLDGSDFQPNFIPVTAGYKPTGIALQGGYLYWTNYSGGTVSEGSVGRAALDGTAVTQNFISLSGSSDLSVLGLPQGIAVDGDYIYWGNQFGGTVSALTYTPTIRRASRSTGAVDSGFGVEATGMTLGDLTGLALDDGHIYWANSGYNAGSSGSIGRYTFSGSVVEPQFIAFAGSVTDNPVNVAVDAAHLYWSGSKADAIGRSNIDGSGSNRSFIDLSGTSGRPWGLALGPANAQLSLSLAGAGSGSVVSSPAGIDCGSTCSATFSEGSTVTLTASAASGSTFSGWAGAGCSGTGSCAVTMSGAQSVTATFTEDTPPTPPVPPTNDFTIRPLRTVGSVLREVVRLPGSGRVVAAGTFRPIASSGGRSTKVVKACSSRLTASKAGSATVICRLTAVARAARRNHSLSVTLRTTFTPTGGTARTVTRVIALKKISGGVTG